MIGLAFCVQQSLRPAYVEPPRKNARPVTSVMVARREAIKLGQKFYIGAKCGKCGKDKRRTSNSHCVHCSGNKQNSMRKNVITARKAAIAAGETTYHGAPCGHCGRTLRSVKKSHCLNCRYKRKA